MATGERQEQTQTSEVRPKVGLALAGGAPQGAIYEIGALKALDEALGGSQLDRLQVYVGVSAGGFLCSCLANRLTTDQMVRAIVKQEPGEHPFVPETFFQPAVGEIGRRLGRLPSLVGSALRDYLMRRERRLLDALTSLSHGLPVGIFANEPVRQYVANIFDIKGRSDDFRELEARLFVVSTDLESGESVCFGSEGWDHVPISTAVQATTALPGLYPPVEIDGRFYVDGILRKTMHASVALEAGAKLVFAINPIVPVDTRPGVRTGELENGKIVRQGLTKVLSQSVRTLIHSRMSLGVSAYDTRFPDADVVLLEPPADDYESFFSNIFSFAARRAVCERAYRLTRRTLLERYDELQPVLARHGMALDLAILQDRDRDLWSVVGLSERDASKAARAARRRTSPRRRTQVLGDLDHALARLERLVGSSGDLQA